jgi:hypothetical protein
MLKFFFTRYAFKQPVISEAASQEALQALKEIKKLGKSNNLDDLSMALVLISRAERRFPFFQDAAFYCRGEVIEAMSKNPDFMRKSNTDVKPSHTP